MVVYFIFSLKYLVLLTYVPPSPSPSWYSYFYLREQKTPSAWNANGRKWFHNIIPSHPIHAKKLPCPCLRPHPPFARTRLCVRRNREREGHRVRDDVGGEAIIKWNKINWLTYLILRHASVPSSPPTSAVRPHSPLRWWFVVIESEKGIELEMMLGARQ